MLLSSSLGLSGDQPLPRNPQRITSRTRKRLLPVTQEISGAGEQLCVRHCCHLGVELCQKPGQRPDVSWHWEINLD